MKEKKNYLKLVILIILVIIVGIVGFLIYNKSSKEPEKINENMTPLLYKVTKEGSVNEMYLFGSIHMANKEDLLFPKYIMDAYNKSHYLACEIDEESLNIDMNEAQALVYAMMYQDGTTIKDHINEDIYNKLVEFLTNKNSYVNAYDYYKPMFFYSLLSVVAANDANLSSDSGIDNYFISKAKKDGKEVLEVESMEFQTNLLLSFSDKLYELIIKETIDNYDDSVEELKELYDNWKKGNEKKILELNDEEIKNEENYSEEIKKEIENYNKLLITDRNKTMTETAINYFEDNKDVFFMVGTLHIIGEDGIANNLRNNGYTVTRVYP